MNRLNLGLINEILNGIISKQKRSGPICLKVKNLGYDNQTIMTIKGDMLFLYRQRIQNSAQ